MPSVAEEHPRLVLPGRKRRRDNDPNNLQGPLYEKLAAQYSAVTTTNWNADGAFGRPVQQQLLQQQQPNFFPIFPSNHNHNDRPIFEHGCPGTAGQNQQQQQNLDAVPRKIAPLPVPKRQRMFDEEEDTNIECWEAPNPTTSPQRQRQQSKSPQRGGGALQVQTDAKNRPKTPSSSLSPCYICHRRPTKKSDLDSFADCQGCRQRTCYVCIRECQGWRKDGQPGDVGAAEEEEEAAPLSRSFHMDDVDDTRQRQKEEGRANASRGTQQAKRQGGWTGGRHRQMVCSRCCIEKGSEGDIVCLGCLSRMESV
ncbi:hypothetical protein CMUS01_01162 [Colletotrichum musicola]|uniref:Uncharacterized protein n=1 Tax=Colletotrichum musicola TaxID=2175873 RepID=A0A8H6NXK1_9PEZI|nr:hypothetical protein CMUS01_01162 [Colletotrichum musicola]